MSLSKKIVFYVVVVLLIALALTANVIAAVSPQVEMVRAVGQRADTIGIVEAHNGSGYVYAGYNFVMHLDKNGELVWWDNPQGNAKDIIKTRDGGYMVVGETTENVPGYHIGSAGLMGRLACLWVAKYNVNGELEWQKAWGGSGSDTGDAIAELSDGSFIVVGKTSSKDGAAVDNNVLKLEIDGEIEYRPLTSMWVMRIDQKGSQIWQKFLGNASKVSEWPGGNRISADARSVYATADGGAIVAGHINVAEGTKDNCLDGDSSHDAWVVKLNSKGEVQWDKCYGGFDTEWFETISQTADGGYIAAGFTHSNDGQLQDVGDFIYPGLNYHKAWVVRLNRVGEVVWQKTLGGQFKNNIHSIIEVADDKYIFTGYTSGERSTDKHYWLGELTNRGNLQWQYIEEEDSDSEAMSVVMTSKGDLAVVGKNSKLIDANSKYGLVVFNYGGQKKTTAPVSIPSAWAAPEVEAAKQYGLTTERVLSDYQRPITREEFCELAVKVYETLSGQEAQPAGGKVFIDTNNLEILKAYNLEIVAGVGAGRFAPDNLVTREQIAVMFYRTMNAARPSMPAPEQAAIVFKDNASVSSWASEAVDDMSARGIIGGMGDGSFAPQGQATREQAIALVKRVYEDLRAEK